ncbi:MAG: class I tRNA ligase family protein, partial [Coriobacteriales bacterium]|nr:class I tRNA ligase family protein [Coriobacteriales bacterium]
PDKDLEWSQEGLDGIERFLNRVWRSVFDLTGEAVTDDEGNMLSHYDAMLSDGDIAKLADTLNRERHRVIAKVQQDIERFNFNTAISAIMELVNAVSGYLKVPVDKRDAKLASACAKTLVLLVAPITPHFAEELWHGALGNQDSVHEHAWPEYDESQIAQDTVELAVQVGGKVKAHIEVAADAAEDDVKATALEAISAIVAGKEPRKVIVVPGRLVNVVL